jgi:hypothetical protein
MKHARDRFYRRYRFPAAAIADAVWPCFIFFLSLRMVSQAGGFASWLDPTLSARGLPSHEIAAAEKGARNSKSYSLR